MKHLPTLCPAVGAPLVALLLALLLAACDHSFLFDREGYCPEEPEPAPEPAAPTYWAQFVYDYNMDYADYFAAQVSTLTLYAATSDGTVVWQSTVSAPDISAAGYALALPLAPGTYSLLLWGGTDAAGTFTIPSDATTLSALTATMAREYDDHGNAYSAAALDRWFYAYLPDATFPAAAGDYTYTLSLTKDTNIFHISLTDEDGNALDSDAFTVTISAANGDLAWDNSLAASAETITYYPWATRGSTLTADLTTSRLVEGSSQQLIVAYDNEEIINIPLLDDLLLIKGNYPQEMSNQEFLDREDEWTLEFTIAHEGGEEEDKYYWLPAVIYINSWRVVLQEHGL